MVNHTTTRAAQNGFTPDQCEVKGCTAAVHGRGLCRTHYDERRYSESVSRDAVRLDAHLREQLIRDELRLGSVPTFQSPHGTNSMFETEFDLFEAWQERREELLEHYLSEPYVGLRPWGWWEFEARRPHHLTERPQVFIVEGSEEDRAEALDEYLIEPFVFLARRGDLTEREIEALRVKADEASPRIGTNAEHVGSGGMDRADRRAVKLYERIMEALS